MLDLLMNFLQHTYKHSWKTNPQVSEIDDKRFAPLSKAEVDHWFGILNLFLDLASAKEQDD